LNLSRDHKFIIYLFQQRIKEHYWQKINGDFGNLSENRLYMHLNSLNTNNNYLFTVNERYIRYTITKMRLGSHNFMIERGSWNNPEVIDRQCSTCFKLEEEYHCIIECQRYNEWRQLYLYVKPSMFKKLIQFLKEKKLGILASFVKKSLTITMKMFYSFLVRHTISHHLLFRL